MDELKTCPFCGGEASIRKIDNVWYVVGCDDCPAPTVDAEEVVRCKDCKHMKIDRNGYRWCLVWTGINGMGDDGFCNYGERKDND